MEDARHPQKYRMLVGMVDTIFADVAQPDQARIVALNAQYFLKPGGNFIISIKANCIDSTAGPPYLTPSIFHQSPTFQQLNLSTTLECIRGGIS